MHELDFEDVEDCRCDGMRWGRDRVTSDGVLMVCFVSLSKAFLWYRGDWTCTCIYPKFTVVYFGRDCLTT